MKEKKKKSPEKNLDKEVIVYDLSPCLGRVVPGERRRVWMDNTTDEYAYRCLPMNMANMTGWDVQAPCDITASWRGGDRWEDIEIVVSNEQFKGFVHSQFGYGVLTFSLGILMKTPEGVNLLVKGIPNEVRRGITALEGLCETDWSPATFTMNWQFTEPNYPVTFKKGDVVARMIPYPRNYIEQFTPKYQFISQATPEYREAYMRWNRGRATFLSKLTSQHENEAKSVGWQKQYMQGKIGEIGAREHQTKVKVKKVVDERQHNDPHKYPHFDDVETVNAHRIYEAQMKGDHSEGPTESVEEGIDRIKGEYKEGRSRGLSNLT